MKKTLTLAVKSGEDSACLVAEFPVPLLIVPRDEVDVDDKNT